MAAQSTHEGSVSPSSPYLPCGRLRNKSTAGSHWESTLTCVCRLCLSRAGARAPSTRDFQQFCSLRPWRLQQGLAPATRQETRVWTNEPVAFRDEASWVPRRGEGSKRKGGVGHLQASARLPPALPAKAEEARSLDTESWRPGVGICQNGVLGQRTHRGGQSPSGPPGAGLPSSSTRRAMLWWRLLLRAPLPSFWGRAPPRARGLASRAKVGDHPSRGPGGVSGERPASRGQGAGRPRGDFRRFPDRLSLPKFFWVCGHSVSGVTLAFHFCSF